MSTADSIDVRITGNASGAVEASKLSAEAVDNATRTMRQRLIDLGLASRESFGMMGEAASVAATRVAEAGEHIAHSTEAMHHKFEALTGVIAKVNAAFLAIGLVLAGGEAFEKGIEKANELTAENLKLSKTLGVTLEAASGLHSAMARLGISTDTVVGAVQKLDRQVRTHEKSLNDLGVKTRDASGAYLNQLDILFNATEALKGYAAGTDRNIAAQAMFGRGAGEVTALLRLNRDAMEEGLETAKRLGLVTGQDNVDAMRAYKASINEVHEVFEGFWVAIGVKLMPVLTNLAEWFEHHGPAVIDATKNAITVLEGTIRFVIAGFAALDVVLSTIAGALAILGSGAVTTGKILWDALTLNWSAIGADWQAGMNNLKTISHDAAAQIRGDWAAMDFISPLGTGKGKPDAPNATGKLDAPVSGVKKAKAAKAAKAPDDPMGDMTTTFNNNLLKMDMESKKTFAKIANNIKQGPILPAMSKMTDLVVAKWRTGVEGMVGSWSGSLSRMLTFQQGFSATIGQLWGAMTNLISGVLSSVINDMVMDWLDAHGVMKAISKLFGVSEVTTSASKAGANAYASIAAIPIIGPELAPAAGATAFAGALSFASGLSASGGFDIPAGMNPMVQTHAREMILPAKHADVIRDLADNGGAGRGGGMTVHIHATDYQSFEKMIERSPGAVARSLSKAIRNGVRS